MSGKILLALYGLIVIGLILFILHSVVGLMPTQRFDY